MRVDTPTAGSAPEMIDIPLTLPVKPWSAPRFASLGRDEESTHGSIPVSKLSDEALLILAQRWIDDLYKFAGKQPPSLEPWGALRHG